MLSFSLIRHARMTVLQLNGEVRADGQLDALCDAFAFVPPDEELVLELSETTALDARSASLIHDVLMTRAVTARTVVVSPRAQISMQLVLHNVDRASSIVPTMGDALDILARPLAARPRTGTQPR
jgi:hypothetical protein